MAYLGMTNTFALLRLLPMSDQDKDTEILALRHQITILERQLGDARTRFSPADRAFLAALLHRLPTTTLHRLRLLVRPETVLRRHRDLLARCHADRSRPQRPGRPRTIRSIRLLVLRLARKNPAWGYRRIQGELLGLGIEIAASTVWQILKDAGIDPAPEHTTTTWSVFLRSQADALMACDFFETTTLTGTRLYVLADIEHASRRIRVLGATAHPTASWVTQAARNLAMDLEDAGRHVRFLIRDRDGKYPAPFDDILADAGIQTVLSGVRIPRMNAIMERWIHSCRRELLDRTLIWNQQHLLHALREYEHFYNTHHPTEASPTPHHYNRCHNRPPIKQPSPTSTSADDRDWAASSTRTTTPPDLHGRHFRQAQGSLAGPTPLPGHGQLLAPPPPRRPRLGRRQRRRAGVPADLLQLAALDRGRIHRSALLRPQRHRCQPVHDAISLILGKGATPGESIAPAVRGGRCLIGHRPVGGRRIHKFRSFSVIARQPLTESVQPWEQHPLGDIGLIEMVSNHPFQLGRNDHFAIEARMRLKPVAETCSRVRHGRENRRLVDDAIIKGRWLKEDGNATIIDPSMLIELFQAPSSLGE